MNATVSSNLTSVLNVANGRNHQRIVTVNEATSLIDYAESIVKQLPADVRPHIAFEYQDGVANAYKYAATATRLVVRFDADGEAVSATATRTSAPKRPFGRATRRLSIAQAGLGKLEGFPGGYKQI